MGAFDDIFGNGRSESRKFTEEEKRACREYWWEHSNTKFNYPWGKITFNYSFIGPFSLEDRLKVLKEGSYGWDRETKDYKKSVKILERMIKEQIKGDNL